MTTQSVSSWLELEVTDVGLPHPRGLTDILLIT